jgi:hypothetical protein
LIISVNKRSNRASVWASKAASDMLARAASSSRSWTLGVGGRGGGVEAGQGTQDR